MSTKMVKRILLVGCEAFSILISLYLILWSYRNGSLFVALVFFVIEALPPILLLEALFRPGGTPSNLIVLFGTALPALEFLIIPITIIDTIFSYVFGFSLSNSDSHTVIGLVFMGIMLLSWLFIWAFLQSVVCEWVEEKEKQQVIVFKAFPGFCVGDRDGSLSPAESRSDCLLTITILL